MSLLDTLLKSVCEIVNEWEACSMSLLDTLLKSMYDMEWMSGRCVVCQLWILCCSLCSVSPLDTLL